MVRYLLFATFSLAAAALFALAPSVSVFASPPVVRTIFAYVAPAAHLAPALFLLFGLAFVALLAFVAGKLEAAFRSYRLHLAQREPVPISV